MEKSKMAAEIARQTAHAWEKQYKVEYQECPVCETFKEYNDFANTNLLFVTATGEWFILDRLCKTLGIDYSEEMSATQSMKYMDMIWNEKKLYEHKEKAGA